VRVLSIVHEDGSGAGLFADVVRELDHEYAEWRIDRDPEPPAGPVDAALVFGGTMNAHEEEDHAWLRREDDELRRMVAGGTPVLGVCLGGQLLAKALDARVVRSAVPEIGWQEVVLRPEAAGDPVVGALPDGFLSFQWHHYRFELPDGAVPLASSPVCLQAFRFGDHVWGVQFHPEVTREILQHWIDSSESQEGLDLDYRALERECDLWIGEWNRIGRAIVSSFLGVAAGRETATEGRAA
jgi:GMP synthase-like glutamine amidotransferase